MRLAVPRHWSPAALSLCCVLGVGRIVDTYHTFDQTWDEPAHIAAGLEWLQLGTFRFEAMHPPLPRVAVALGPYLAGLRLPGAIRPDSLGFFEGRRALFDQGNAVLKSNGAYARNLRLARLGNLPFFIAACILVWGWARALYGDAAAVAAVGLFSTVPSVLAHSAIATTDMALVAALTGALWSWTRWLEAPSRGRSLAAGAATGLAFVSKMSAVVFLPMCLLGLIALRWRFQSHATPPVLQGQPHRPWAGRAALAAVATGLVVWSVYRFSVGSVADVDPRIPSRIEQHLGDGVVARGASVLAGLRIIPAPELLKGFKDLLYYNSEQRKSYLLGHVVPHGTPAFFPVAIFFKTPLPFLVLAGVGIVAAARRTHATRRWEPVAPLVVATLIVAVVVPSHINIGSRHVLAAFPALAMLAGLGVTQLWRAARLGRAATPLTAVLLAWQLELGAQVHPDYLAYFNELAALAPQPILLDSDLDWGQDLKRLADTLAALKVTDSIHIAYHGSADLSERGLPPFALLAPYTPTSGWVAISIYKLKMGIGSSERSDHFAWLEAYTPVATVGRSILLYHIPKPVNAGPGQSPTPLARVWRSGAPRPSS